MTDIAVDFAGQTFRSPIVLASGIWGTTVDLLVRAAELGCGAVTAKSCGPSPRTGHPNPTCLDWGSGLINAIGLANPGAVDEVELLQSALTPLKALQVPLIASIFAGTAQEFGEVAATVCRAKPNFVEVNISCPNVGSEYGEPFAGNPLTAADVTKQVKSAAEPFNIPVIIKLAPNVPDVAQIGRAVVDAGADALCAVNTMPGMVIDASSGRPVLANGSGGISGKALKPIALKCVYDLHHALPNTPIIGTGGVITGTDAIEMIMAGATAVGIGSAIYYRGPETIAAVHQEIQAWLTENHVDDILSLRGRAHEPVHYSSSPSTPPVPHL